MATCKLIKAPTTSFGKTLLYPDKFRRLLILPCTMAELIPTNLVIADRTYRVRIQPKDEEIVRRTIKTVNDKLVEYKTQFAGKDIQDYIAMVLIWLATEQQGAGASPVQTEAFSEQLQSLERMIDEALEP